MVIYYLGRFGRGGQYTRFNDSGYPSVLIIENNEHYDRQHHDLLAQHRRTVMAMQSFCIRRHPIRLRKCRTK